MPDPQRLLSAEEFAGSVRQKLAATHGKDPYAHLDDLALTAAIVKKYPVYKDRVVDPLGGFEGIDLTQPDPRVLAMQARAEGEIAQQDSLAAAARRMSAEVAEASRGPSGAFAGPLGILAGMVSPKVGAALDLPAQGLRQAGTGVIKTAGSITASGSPAAAVASPLFKSGASDIIEGAGMAALPALPAAAAAAPLATVMGLLTGLPAQYGATKLAEASGLEHEDSRLIGNVVGTAVGGVGSIAPGMARRGIAQRALNQRDEAIIARTRAYQFADDSLADRFGYKRETRPPTLYDELHRPDLTEILNTEGRQPPVVAQTWAGAGRTATALVGVAEPPPAPSHIAQTGRQVQAVPAARPDRKAFAILLDRIKAGQVDPADRALSAFERAAAQTYQRTGTLTIEDLGVLHGRFAKVGQTVGQAVTQAEQLGTPPPTPGVWDPARALPPAGTSVIGGVEQSILDQGLQARLDGLQGRRRFLGVPPDAALRLDVTSGRPPVLVQASPELPPEIEVLGNLLRAEIEASAGRPLGPPQLNRGGIQPGLRLTPPPAGDVGAPPAPTLLPRGRRRPLKFGQPPPELQTPPAAFDQGAGPIGVSPEGQLGLPIDPAYRMRLGQLQRKLNPPVGRRFRIQRDAQGMIVRSPSGKPKRVAVPGSGEPGPIQVGLDELSEPELLDVGRMLVAMESGEFTPHSFIEPAAGQGGSPEVIGGAAGHPIYWNILKGDAESGHALYGHYTRPQVEAALRDFLHHGRRSVISDLAVELARNPETGGRHAASMVPDDFARSAARLPDGPGFAPLEGVARVEGVQPRLGTAVAPDAPPVAPPELAEPAWLREADPELVDEPGAFDDPDVPAGQAATGIGAPPPRPQAPASPGRVPSALDDPEFLAAAQDEDVPLPGLGKVRDTEIATPEFDAPFALGRESVKGPTGQQGNLLGEPPPVPGKGKARPSTSGLDNPRLFDAEGQGKPPGGPRPARPRFVLDVPPPVEGQPATKKAFTRWLNQRRAEHYAEPWFEAADAARQDGDYLRAYRIAAMASGEGAASHGSRTRLANADRGSNVGLGTPPPAIPAGRAGVNEYGLNVPPRMVPNLRPEFTDLRLGRQILETSLKKIDHLAEGVVLTEGNQNPELRLNRQVVSELLAEAKLGKGELKSLARMLGQKPEQVARHLIRQASTAGKILNAWSQYRARNIDAITFLEKTGADVSGLDPEGAMAMAAASQTQAKLRAAQRVADQAKLLDLLVTGNGPAARVDRLQLEHALASNPNKVYLGLFNDIENFSRALIVSKPSTAIRNLWTQTGRYAVGMLDQALSAPLAAISGNLPAAKAHLQVASEMVKAPFRKGAGVTPRRAIHETMQAVFDYTQASLAGLKPGDVRKTLGVLDRFPQLSAEFMGSAAGDLAPGGATGSAAQSRTARAMAKIMSPRVRNVITALNRSAEFSQRSVVFDALFRAGLRQKGIDPNLLLIEDFQTIVSRVGTKEIEELTAAATYAALDFTFASKPLHNSIPGKMLHLFNDIPGISPLLRTGYPFPRFNLVAAPRFIYDHSPAALLDLLRLPVDMLTPGNAPKGRLYVGTQAAKIQRDFLPRMEVEIRQAEVRHGLALQSWAGARLDASKAARKLKRLERRAARAGTLKGLETEYQGVMDSLRRAISDRDVARQQVLTSKREWRGLQQNRARMEQKIRQAKSIGAPTTHEYFARQGVGLAMLGAALVVRQSEGAKGTQWYEYRVGDRTVDFRPFAPFVQYLLVADWLNDLQKETDWTKVRDGAAGSVDPLTWNDQVRQHYHGKYTNETMSKQMVQAFLSISQAAGTTLSALDILTGDTTSQGTINDVWNTVVGTAGQFLSRFTVPLQTINEVHGQFDEDARMARIPEDPVPGDRKSLERLTQPTIGNIPVLRETIPPKVTPTTGKPMATIDPIARAFGGITQRERGRFEQELARVGLPFYKATPRQVGDRQFDNAVAVAYHQGLQKYLTKLLGNKTYQKMPTDLQRETLQGFMSQLKGYAYAQVGKSIGARELREKLQRPGDKERVARWRAFLTTLRAEDAKEQPAGQAPPAGGEDQIGAPPPVPTRVGGG
jgi:hypothetical protein